MVCDAIVSQSKVIQNLSSPRPVIRSPIGSIIQQGGTEVKLAGEAGATSEDLLYPSGTSLPSLPDLAMHLLEEIEDDHNPPPQKWVYRTDPGRSQGGLGFTGSDFSSSEKRKGHVKPNPDHLASTKFTTALEKS